MAWIVKTAADYENAIAGLQAQINEAVKAAQGAGNQETIDFGLDVLSRAQNLAPVDTGLMRSQAEASVNGVVIKAPGMPPTNMPGRFDDVASLHMEIGWRGPIVTTKDGRSYNLAFIQHEHVEFVHQNGQAKFLETALDEARPTFVARIRKRVVREMVENALR